MLWRTRERVILLRCYLLDQDQSSLLITPQEQDKNNGYFPANRTILLSCTSLIYQCQYCALVQYFMLYWVKNFYFSDSSRTPLMSLVTFESGSGCTLFLYYFDWVLEYTATANRSHECRENAGENRFRMNVLIANELA